MFLFEDNVVYIYIYIWSILLAYYSIVYVFCIAHMYFIFFICWNLVYTISIYDKVYHFISLYYIIL